MIDNMIGKNVEITVAFSGGAHQGGSLPVTYRGKILEVDENFCKIIASGMSISGFLGSKNFSNQSVIINKKYIISIMEI